VRTKNNQRGFGRDPEWLILIVTLVILSAIAAPIAKKLGLHPAVGVLVVLGLYAIYFIYLRIQDHLYRKEEKRKIEAEIARCGEALESNREDPQAHYNLGVALSCNGQLDAAVASFRRTLELDPSCASAHYPLGQLLNQSGQIDDAITSIRKALEIKPDFAEALHARNELGVLLRKKGEHEAAQREFAEAERLYQELFRKRWDRMPPSAD
jgi:tetratricopeptide (TPR) repeat protein